MKTGKILLLGCLFFCISFGSQAAYAARTLKMVVMASQSLEKETPKYKALAEYIALHLEGINKIDLKVAKDYPAAIEMFESADADAMFSGSFTAAIFIKKGMAVPLVRPVSENDVSTYKALIIAPEGTPVFKGPSDLEGKRVAYCALASSGEVFARGLIAGADPKEHYAPMIMKNHESAIQAVIANDADLAIVKNLTYGSGDGYPGTTVIGEDVEENPNNTLIMTYELFSIFGEDIQRVLLDLEKDMSPEAAKLKSAFGIKGFTKTTEKDFEHTYQNLQKAKIDVHTFNFTW